MANTFELIASSTVGAGGAASIDFTSIPSTYTDLCLKVSTRQATSTAWIQSLSFNGVTTNLSMRMLQGGGGNAASTSGTTAIPFIANGADGTANTFANTEIYIPNYTGNSYKSVSIDSVGETNGPDAYMRFTAGLWSSTAAITSITITTDFAQHSTAYLYGIKKS